MMKKASICASILFMSVTVIIARSTTSPAATAVRNVLIESVAAFERGDFPTIERLWSHGDEASVFEGGHANYGWADYRDHHLKPELAEMKNVSYRLDDVQPHVSGSMAWATFKYSIAADHQGQRFEGSGIGTAILEKSGKDWKIVHWHTSSPRKKPEAAPSKKE